MVSPNLFLKLNISFNLIIGFLIIYYRTLHLCADKYILITSILGILFIYISINNIIILRQKKASKLKKDILKINTLLYCIIGIFILFDKNLNTNIILLILNLFALILNFIGFKITKI